MMNSNIARWGIGGCLITAILLTISCASKGSASGPGYNVEWDNALKTYTVTVPPDRCWSVDFTDANGDVIDTTGPQVGPKAGHMPEGTVSYDYKELDCEEPKALMATPGGRLYREGEELIAASLHRYVTGAISADPAGSGELFAHVDVFAFDENRADRKRERVAIGQPLPAMTSVHALIAYEVVGSDVLISSALPTQFGSFTAELDGVVVAEPGNGVLTTGAGHGWVVQTASLPMAYFSSGNRVTVTQSGIAPGSTPILVDVEF